MPRLWVPPGISRGAYHTPWIFSGGFLFSFFSLMRGTDMNVCVIYNPRAGNGRAKKLLPQVQRAFHAGGIQADILQTEFPGHAVELVQQVPLKNYDGIVAAGGDGTIFEVLNGLLKRDPFVDVPLGVLPIGTGNAFARDLDLTNRTWQRGIELIARNQPSPVDVGTFRTDGNLFYFLNILGMGFVTDIAQTASHFKWLGNMAYSIGVFVQLARLSATPVILEADGRTLTREMIFVEVSNSRYTSNFLIAPHASLVDGKLDVVVLNPMSRWRLIRSFSKIFTGEHIHLPEVETFQVNRLRITTDTGRLLSPDGELLGSTPVEIECIPGAIRVFQ